MSGPDTVQVMRSLAEIAKDKVKIQKAYLVSCVNRRLEDLEAAAKVIKGQKVAAGVEFYVAAASARCRRTPRRAAPGARCWTAGAKPLPSGCGPCIGLGVGLLEDGRGRHLRHQPQLQGPHGQPRREGLPGQPRGRGRVGRGRLHHGARRGGRRRPAYTFAAVAAKAAGADGEGRILDGFPGEDRGARWSSCRQDNLNTDGIYGKDYTYREDMTPEEMAQVVMENYDPTFARKVRARAT